MTENAQKEGLLGCPFCSYQGGNTDIIELNGFTVTCGGCGCQLTCNPTYEEAIKAWNTRTHPAPIPDEEKLVNLVRTAWIYTRVVTEDLDKCAREVLAALKPYLRNSLDAQINNKEVCESKTGENDRQTNNSLDRK